MTGVETSALVPGEACRKAEWLLWAHAALRSEGEPLGPNRDVRSSKNRWYRRARFGRESIGNDDRTAREANPRFEVLVVERDVTPFGAQEEVRARVRST